MAKFRFAVLKRGDLWVVTDRGKVIATYKTDAEAHECAQSLVAQ